MKHRFVGQRHGKKISPRSAVLVRGNKTWTHCTSPVLKKNNAPNRSIRAERGEIRGNQSYPAAEKKKRSLKKEGGSSRLRYKGKKKGQEKRYIAALKGGASNR